MPNKKFWDNSNLQQDIEWGNIELPGVSDEELLNTNWNLHWAKSDLQKQKISNTLRGKSLAELIGEERAAAGKESRRIAHLGRKRPKGVGENIAAGRRANGSYDGRSMRGKSHKESTKDMMAIKAKVRQQLKRELGLGKSDKVPKELLEERYILLGLKTQ